MKRVEEIKYIPGTNNAYGCDKLGNIYSYHIPGGNFISDIPQKIKSQWVGSNGRYKYVSLSLEKEEKNYLVHRLIAETWIENPNNFPEIHHLDNDDKNNCINNLQWCDREYNISQQVVDKGSLNGLRSKAKLYREADNYFIAEFPSITAACEYSCDNFGCSMSGMKRNHKSKGYYIVADNENARKKQGEKNKSKWELYSPDNISLGAFNSKKTPRDILKIILKILVLKDSLLLEKPMDIM